MTSRRQADATIPSAVELRHKLNHELSIIGSQESPLLVRRHAVTKLLETLSTFVGQWERNSNSQNAGYISQKKSQTGDFPSGVMREAFSSLVFHVGQGDGQFRDYLLQQLKQSKTLPPRQLFLDFLPLAMPMISRDNNSSTASAVKTTNNTNNSSELEAITKQVIESLRAVLGRDPSTLIPIIGCLSSMPLTKMGQQESFQVALKSLEFVSEGDLPILVRALLKHAETEEDAVLALESLRTELLFIETSESESKESFIAVEAGGDAITMVAHVVLNALFGDMDNATSGEGNRIGKAYVAVLERIILPSDDSIENDAQDTLTSSNNATKNDNTSPQLVVLDIMVALSIFQHPDFADDMESLLDFLLRENQFPFSLLSNLMLLICDKKRHGRPTSILYPRLVQSLVAFSMFLLLTPARVSVPPSFTTTKHDNLQEVMKQAQHFIMELHHLVDREVQAEIVHILLQLSDKVSSSNWAAKKTSHHSHRRRQPVGLLSMAFSSTMLWGDYYYDADNEQCEWYQVMIADTVNATLQALAKTAKQSYSNFKHVLVGRLTSSVSEQTTPQWEQYCTRQLCGTLSALCEPAVGSSSNAASGGNSGIQATEIMILLQKLLFTSSYTAFASSSSALGGHFGGADSRRIVRGLMLATELIKSMCLGHGDWDCVRQWVLRILLPTTRRMVEPEIGTPGLAFLEALMIDRGEASGDREDNEEKNQISLELIKGSFEHMKMVLANTGLIQILAVYQQQMQTQQDSRGGCDSSALAYTASTPDLFMTQSAKKRKNRQMVFCLAFFLRNSDIYLPSRWGNSVEWVFRLVETYLRVGRTVSLFSAAQAPTGNVKRKKSQGNKWVPHGWLQAAIEFPSLVLNRNFEPDNDKQRQALEWTSRLFSNEINLFTPSTMDSTDDAASGITELLLKADTLSQLRPIIETMMRLGLSSLLSMSLSFAVVKNAFAHCQCCATDGSGKDDQIESLRLIQFQLVKIYDMRRKSEHVERLISSALICVQKFARRFRQDASCQSRDSSGSRVGQEETTTLCSRNSGSSGSKKRLDDDFEMAKGFRENLTSSLGELKRLRQNLFSSQDFVAFDVVYACLTDSEQSNFMKEAINTLISSSPLSDPDATVSKLHRLAVTRHCLLDHIISLVLGHSRTGMGFQQNKLYSHRVSHFTQCVDFGVYLCSALPKLQKSSSSDLLHGNMEDSLESISTIIESLSSLTATYLRYICVLLARATGREPDMAGNATGMRKAGHSKPIEKPNALNSFTDYVEACSNVLVSRCILNEKEKHRSSAAALTFAGFLSQLHSCNFSSIAYQLLEILSILALSSKEIPSQEMLTASWKAMHTVYDSTEECRGQGKLPYSVAFYIHREGNVFQQTNSLKKCLHDTVWKPSVGRHDAIRLSLLRHFGVLSLSACAADSGINQILKVFEDLSSLLDSIDGPLLGTAENDSNEEKKEDGRQESRAPNSKASRSDFEKRGSGSGAIPDLHPASFVVAFETLLHIAVAGMAVLSFPAPGKSVPGRENVVYGTKASGPYQCFQNLLILFGGLLELYETKTHLFPQRSVPTIFTAAKHMLAMTVRRLNGLVEWRNAQPLLSTSERAQGAYDQGDTRYLEVFIKACWTHAIARPLAFCDYVKMKALESEAKLPARRQQPADENDDGDNSRQDRRVAIVRSRNRLCSKANALRHTIEKSATVFLNNASAHNFSTSDFVHDIAESVVGSPCLKRKCKDSEADVGFHQLDGTSRIKELAHVLAGSRRPTKKLRRLSIEEDSDNSDGEPPPPSSRKSGNGKTNRSRLTIIDSYDEEEWKDNDSDSEAEDSLQMNENHNPSSDGSFCANGNWGEEDESKGSSSSESLGLELETPIFS